MLSLGVPSVPLGGRQAARADMASIALAVMQRVQTWRNHVGSIAAFSSMFQPKAQAAHACKNLRQACTSKVLQRLGKYTRM